MTIEFHCPHCDKLLKTPDEKAGVRANCPGCGQVVTIPNPILEESDADPSFAEIAAGPETSAPDSSVAREPDRQVVEPGSADAHSLHGRSQYDMKPCPMCGAAIDKTAVRCRFCGEVLAGPGASVRARTNIDAGEVLNHAWNVYRARLGLLIGSLFVLGGISFAVSLAGSLVQQLLLGGIGLAGGGGRPANLPLIVFGFVGLTLFVFVLNIAVSAFLQAGFHGLLLGVARREATGISAMFSGSPFFWRFFWGTLLYQIAVTIGFAMCFIPGIVLLLMFWPVYFVIVDRDSGVIDSLQLAHEVTTGNYFAVFVLFLAGIGCQILGVLPGFSVWFLTESPYLAIVAGCVGLALTIPFWMILWPVTYCGMSGQLAAQPA